MVQDLARHHRAHGVTAEILRSGIAAAIAVPAGDGVESANLQLGTEHVAFAHNTSIATPPADSTTHALAVLRPAMIAQPM